jgi:hypothetical protein
MEYRSIIVGDGHRLTSAVLAHCSGFIFSRCLCRRSRAVPSVLGGLDEINPAQRLQNLAICATRVRLLLGGSCAYDITDKQN